MDASVQASAGCAILGLGGKYGGGLYLERMHELHTPMLPLPTV